ncbi:4084_t:CDS:2 [Entrophospora sp. SA101]|nr:4084_t:CDS:2 [Entrophospora sp. SA101]
MNLNFFDNNPQENKLGTATNTCSPELNTSKAFLRTRDNSLQETDLLAKGIVYNKSIRNNQKDIYKILKKRNLFNKLLLSKDDIKFAKYKLSNPSKEFIKAFVTDGNLRIGENDEKRLHCSLISFMCQLEFVWHKPSFQDCDMGVNE